MKFRKTKSKKLTQEIKIFKKRAVARIDMGDTVRRLRKMQELSGADLCRQAGDLDPKTLTALEKGRIRNPSIRTLQSVARGMQMSIADLFQQAEIEFEENLYQGNQKGAYHLDFPSTGVRIISFTPIIRNFFCGKMIFSAKKKIGKAVLKHSAPIFISPIVGRFECEVQNRKFSIKEGENLFFSGSFDYMFYNPLQREAVMLLVTAPSIM